MSSNNFQMGHCEDCLMSKCEIAFLKGLECISKYEIAFLKGRIEQLEKEKANLYNRCLENEEAMYDAVKQGNDNHLIELVEAMIIT
jgi:hypothetical protein